MQALLIAAVIAASPPLDADSCRSAISTYDSSLSEVSYTIKRYITCVTDSSGKDDCYSEFRRLKSAQDDFETAVNSYKAECGQ